ncbi:metallophosphoesterase family protein [Halobaculum marinum]|uniref:Metallophosphoesterase family protein n=1 Tax=Halobaculum marinum TaxID=3031996 RepID=A0ABD5WUU7_9EURY|nr:metallophosphoesterase family protein [Halobaculum sp. DT55]
MTIYVISDTHFDDPKMVNELDRPFDGVDEMNEALIDNWNSVVDEADTVYHVGDLLGGEPPERRESHALYRLDQLNGTVNLIAGNHAPIPKSSFADSAIDIKESRRLDFQGYSFYFTHKAEHAPDYFDGWIISGHEHENPAKYPFIDPETRRVNVACERIEYRPLLLSDLVSNIKTGERYETLADAPVI